MTKTAGQSPKTTYFWIILFLLTIIVYFLGLNVPLLGPDEPRYSQVAREMFERGDWITPTLGGFHWFEKPALLYWLQIASYNLFGVSEFAARFGSALFGIGTVLSLWVLGRVSEPPAVAGGLILVIENKAKRKAFANWLGLIAASSIGIIVFSHGASFDIILTFPMTATLVAFYVFDSRVQPPATAGGSDRLRVYTSLFAFYFFIGIALLAKGLIGIVFPFAIVSFYYLLSWRLPSKTFILSLFWGTLIAMAVAALWYVPMYERHGYAFIDEFFIQHHFQRFTSNKYFHPQPFYFFFWVLPLMTIPWLPFFFAAIWDFGRNLFHHRATENIETKVEDSPRLPISPSPLLLFSLSWLLVPLVFFSFSGSKLPGYILPAVPAAIILTAEYIWRLVRKRQSRAAWIQIFVGTTLVIVIAALVSVFPSFAETDSVKSLIAAADARGMTNEKVLTLHTISHNAEFYAAGRLLRSEDGKQKKLLGTTEVLEEIRRENGKAVLVLVPLEYLKQLTDSNLIRTEVLKENGELAIVYVSAR